MSADVIQSDAVLRLGKKQRLRRFAGLDCVLRSLVDGDRFNPAAVNFSATLRPVSSRRQSGVPDFAWISRAKPSFTSLAPALLTTAPFIVSGAAKQRSSRCAAALIITSCASVSLTLMIQPFLLSRRPSRSEPLTGTSPGSAEAEGAVGSPAHHARRV